jgi:hypothetical protein
MTLSRETTYTQVFYGEYKRLKVQTFGGSVLASIQ